MTGKKCYLALQTIVCILLVVMLSVSAVNIFREGTARKAENPLESIYTPETAAEGFAPAAPLLFISVGLLIAGLILGAEDENAEKPVRDAEIARDLAASRVTSPSETMKKEQALRKKLQTGGWLGFALCMIPIILFLIDPAHFPEQDLEGMFYSLLRVFVPWTAVGLGVLSVTSVLREKSFLREKEAALIQAKAERAGGISPSPETETGTGTKAKQPAAVQTVFVVAAVVLIIAGIFNGSARDVLIKAVTICTECVGLG